MSYVPKHKPYANQVEALRRLEERLAFALLMAMRTGKTKVIIDDFGRLELAGQIDDLLVIAPAGVYRTWETALMDHASIELLPRLKVHTWQSGAGVKRNRELYTFLADQKHPRVLLMNVEALSSVAQAKEVCEQFLKQRRVMCVIDESTIIKNPTAKRTKFINSKLAPLARYRRILSGLPTPRSPLDLYSQFAFLDPNLLGFSSYWTFRARYAILKTMNFGGRSVQVVVGHRGEEDLQARIAPHSYRVRLEDCYDLPPKIYMKREVELTKEQRRVYSDIKQYATSQLNESSHVTATEVIVQLLRLHQVLCGHATDEGGHQRRLPELRTAALLEQLEEYDGKAIIWCSYDWDIRNVSSTIAKEYGEYSLARFWGGNKNEREAEEKRFLTDPRCRFMIATPAAGGRGRTWLVANLVIYYSNTHDLEHRSQSEERTQAVDKVVPVTYVDLVVPGTVDEKIIKSLRSKINMASTITGDAWREWLI